MDFLKNLTILGNVTDFGRKSGISSVENVAKHHANSQNTPETDSVSLLDISRVSKPTHRYQKYAFSLFYDVLCRGHGASLSSPFKGDLARFGNKSHSVAAGGVGPWRLSSSGDGLN